MQQLPGQLTFFRLCYNFRMYHLLLEQKFCILSFPLTRFLCLLLFLMWLSKATRFTLCQTITLHKKDLFKTDNIGKISPLFKVMKTFHKVKLVGPSHKYIQLTLCLCVFTLFTRPLIFPYRGGSRQALNSECKIYQADFTDWMSLLQKQPYRGVSRKWCSEKYAANLL